MIGVFLLDAQGKTNRQIGDEPFLAEKLERRTQAAILANK